MADKDCYGFSMDPTVNYQNDLTRTSCFMKIGAPLLTRSEFPVASPVEMMQRAGWNRVHVLKMDCEGCEYAIANSVLGCEDHSDTPCDREFFFKVDQLALEIHTTKTFAPTRAHAYGLAKLFWLLEEAGLKLIGGFTTHCAPEDEALGCVEEMSKPGFLCIPACKNVLWARV